MAPTTTRGIIVECEEESDEGSLWKRFAVFRSGLVFGRDTAVQRSVASTNSSSRGKPISLKPCGAPEIASTTTTTTIQEAVPPRAPSATIAATCLSNAQQQHLKQEQQPAADTESILSAMSNAKASGEDETVNDKIEHQQKNDSLSNKPEAQTDTAIAATATTTTTEQPLHVPILPFTLGPYPVPLGGLPHIREETPSVCSDLTKHASLCSEQTLKTKPAAAAAKKLVRFLSGNLMKELERQSEEEEDDDDGSVGDNGDASNAPAADSSQDGMSALGMGSFGGHQQRRRHIDKQDEVDSKDSSFYTRTGAPDSQFRHYNVDVDPTQEDRGADIPLFSAARPHMRGFHMAWMSFFVAL